MSTEENKVVARQFINHASAGEFGMAISLLAEKSRWWLISHPKEFPLAGEFDAHEFWGVTVGNAVASQKEPVRLDIVRLIAEGDHVAVEGTSNALLKNGKKYSNTFVMILEIRDQKIVYGREYVDPLHVTRTMLE